MEIAMHATRVTLLQPWRVEDLPNAQSSREGEAAEAAQEVFHLVCTNSV
jgi:hypothetical protein